VVSDALGTRTQADRRGGGAGTARAAVVALTAVAQVVSAALAPVLLDGDVGAISDDNVHVLTPAGYTFAIWGLIYIASLGYAVYQVLPSQRSRDVHRRTGWWVAAAFAASTLWVPVFVAGQLLVAQVIIVGLVVLLAVAAARLTAMPTNRGADRWGLRLPVTAYLGWATIATVAGAGTTGRWLGVDIGADELVAIAALVAAGLVAALVAGQISAAAGFLATVVWGLAGIAVGTSSGLVSAVATTVAVALVLLLALRAARSDEPGRVLLG
jgi:hypothetical protein